MKNLVQGVGINDISSPILIRKVSGEKWECQFYKRWSVMLQRCYDNKNQTYKDVTVCEEWKIFSNFKMWMIDQDWKGKQLDKDILVTGNKTYSPKTCCFISPRINSILTDRKRDRGKYLIGVTKDFNRFVSRCNNGNNESVYLGRHDTELEANLAYRKYKSQLLFKIANDEIENLDAKIRAALIRISIEIYNG